MNIKFRMPKFQKMTTKGGILKEMAMTVIATSISIVLTFGTAMWLESRQKAESGRQMAMMVISDIDENVELFNDHAKWEEEHLEMAAYVKTHLDQINEISEDTLMEVLDYFVEGVIYIIDDSKERIFNSSQDTWKNIDNPMFINIVQEFYHDRRVYDMQFNTDIAFRNPLSKEEFSQLMTSAGDWDTELIAATLKQLMSTGKGKLFMGYSRSRSKFLYSIAGDWQQKSDQLKFIMGITDDELQEYLNKQQRTGAPVSDEQIFGTWAASSAIGNTDETIEFKRDHRLVHILKQYILNPKYSGKLVIVRTLEATWRLEGDSLYRDYDADVYTLDRSNVTYSDEFKEELEDYFAKYQESLAARNEKAKRDGSKMGHRVNTAFIDRSESKIELGFTEINEDGKEETSTSYMVRQ